MILQTYLGVWVVVIVFRFILLLCLFRSRLVVSVVAWRLLLVTVISVRLVVGVL